MCVCVCVCVCARARMCLFLCVFAQGELTSGSAVIMIREKPAWLATGKQNQTFPGSVLLHLLGPNFAVDTPLLPSVSFMFDCLIALSVKN